jgi:hypothetical protein
MGRGDEVDDPATVTRHGSGFVPSVTGSPDARASDALPSVPAARVVRAADFRAQGRAASKDRAGRGAGRAFRLVFAQRRLFRPLNPVRRV